MLPPSAEEGAELDSTDISKINPNSFFLVSGRQREWEEQIGGGEVKKREEKIVGKLEENACELGVGFLERERVRVPTCVDFRERHFSGLDLDLGLHLPWVAREQRGTPFPRQQARPRSDVLKLLVLFLKMGKLSFLYLRNENDLFFNFIILIINFLFSNL